jgi:hypothetical protein
VRSRGKPSLRSRTGRPRVVQRRRSLPRRNYTKLSTV